MEAVKANSSFFKTRKGKHHLSHRIVTLRREGVFVTGVYKPSNFELQVTEGLDWHNPEVTFEEASIQGVKYHSQIKGKKTG